jgi:hypothetical protein
VEEAVPHRPPAFAVAISDQARAAPVAPPPPLRSLFPLGLHRSELLRSRFSCWETIRLRNPKRARFVSHDPRVVSGSNCESVAGSELNVTPVLGTNDHPPAEHVAGVSRRILSRKRPDVLRPTPSRTIDAAADRSWAELNDNSLAAIEEHLRSVRRIEALAFEAERPDHRTERIAAQRLRLVVDC